MLKLALSSIGALLLIACLIAMISRRFGLPYSAGLVAAGVAIALLPDAPAFPLSRDLIFNLFLPPLIFEGAMQLRWRAFRCELSFTLTLATLGVPVAAAVIAVGMHWSLGWSWIGAGLFGVLIAATDPVAVIAAFREIKVDKRLSITVESESLLNDGIAAVGFAVLAGMAAAAAPSAGGVALQLLWACAGGVAIGAGVAWLSLLLTGRTKDHVVEITLTAIAAYASFLLAEHWHASGVLASLAAGLVIGNHGLKHAISESGRTHVVSFWEFAAFLANSFVFILIGMQVATQPIGAIGVLTIGIAILLVLLSRALSVYPIALLFNRSSLAAPIAHQHVLFWGGLRGALALALALALPAEVPERAAIIGTAFAVVAFSILVQGLTMNWLITKLGLARGEGAELR